MAIKVYEKKYWSKRDQFKTKKYVSIVEELPINEPFDPNDPTTYERQQKEYSCGEVHDPKSWIKAEQKLREIYERKLQHVLGQLKDKMSGYIDLESISSIEISVREGEG